LNSSRRIPVSLKQSDNKATASVSFQLSSATWKSLPESMYAGISDVSTLSVLLDKAEREQHDLARTKTEDQFRMWDDNTKKYIDSFKKERTFGMMKDHMDLHNSLSLDQRRESGMKFLKRCGLGEGIECLYLWPNKMVNSLIHKKKEVFDRLQVWLCGKNQNCDFSVAINKKKLVFSFVDCYGTIMSVDANYTVNLNGQWHNKDTQRVESKAGKYKGTIIEPYHRRPAKLEIATAVTVRTKLNSLYI
jgi:hypothetical protein